MTYRWSMGKVKEMVRESDVVLASWLYPDGVVAMGMAEEVGKPCWIMVLGSDIHHLDHSFRRNAIFDACKKANGILCVWKGLGDRLVSEGVDGKKIHVVPNGVDAELFRVQEGRNEKLQVRSQELEARSERAEVGGQRSEERMAGLEAGQPQEEGKWPQKSTKDNRAFADLPAAAHHSTIPPFHHSSSKIVLFVGNLVPVKGVDRLVKVWSKITSSGTDATLAIIGDGSERGRMERAFAEAAMSGSVTFLGSRPHDEVALWMNAADCLCLASRSEGCPNVVLEAQACGLPVVATDAGACGEMLEKDGVSVLVKMAGRSEEEICADLAAGIRRVLAAGGRVEAPAAGLKMRSWEDMAEEVKELLIADL